MQEKNKSIKKYENWLAPGLAVVLTVILAFYDIYLALIAVALTAFVSYRAYKLDQKRQNELREYIDSLDFAFEGITKNAIFKMPFPIAVLGENIKLLWYNSRFKEMVESQTSIVDKEITEIIPSFDADHILGNDNTSNMIEYRDKKYRVYTNKTKEKEGRLIQLVYFVDETAFQNLTDVYESEKLVITNVQLDNYDELVQTTPSEKRPLLFAEIDRMVTLYFHRFSGSIKKYENDKYLGVIQQIQLEDFQSDKFSFIDEIREIKVGNSLQPTISMGIGKNESYPRLTEQSANAALDIALGRGGDQVVLKDGEDLSYFGGKNKATEKRTKVKARVIAHALGQLIEESSEVFIMGHKNPDMDSFGSALGLLQAVNHKKRPGYIVLKEVTPAIKNLYNRAMKNIEGIQDQIISPDEAYAKVKASSLLIVTDNHRRNSTEEPRLFEKSNKVVVIDHHRRGKDYISDATLIYLEPYASSASELVTEMLMYMKDDIEINQTIAEGLLAGITVDTKNFFYQTGVRTFEAASVLKRHGADSLIVKDLFKDDLDLIQYKSSIITGSERILDRMIVGVFDKELDGSNLIASQAADDLLNAEGIEASFVLTRVAGKTHISARSLGSVSVQLIMEKMNGGGHLTAAATQLDMSIEEAKELLIETIEGYLEGDKK